MSTDLKEKVDLITKFESMSNELIMEIFEYSLFYSFSSLNSRIDNILYHCELSVDFDQIKPTDFVDFIYYILPKFNAKKIRSLRCSNSHQIGVVAYDKSLIYFTHIRSLSLSNTQVDILKYVVSRVHFYRLECVSFDKYLNIWSICLRYIKTALFFDDSFPKPIFLSPTPHYDRLTHLNLNSLCQVCMETIIYLFKSVPRLYYLKLDVKSPCRPELVDPIVWEIFSRNQTNFFERIHIRY